MSDVKATSLSDLMREEMFKRAVTHLAVVLERLGAGPLAELRRSAPEAETPAFWRIYHGIKLKQRRGENDTDWEWVVFALALLTKTSAGSGEDMSGNFRHDPKIPLGAAPRSTEISELRLTRLLNAPFHQRRDATLRLVRRLARTRQCFDFADLARLLLYTDSQRAGLRDLARSYQAAEARENREGKQDV